MEIYYFFINLIIMDIHCYVFIWSYLVQLISVSYIAWDGNKIGS